jgi:hypothetical protein
MHLEMVEICDVQNRMIKARRVFHNSYQAEMGSLNTFACNPLVEIHDILSNRFKMADIFLSNKGFGTKRSKLTVRLKEHRGEGTWWSQEIC